MAAPKAATGQGHDTTAGTGSAAGEVAKGNGCGATKAPAGPNNWGDGIAANQDVETRQMFPALGRARLDEGQRG